MNVTNEIKEEASNEIAEIIQNNSEIQFYYNHNIQAYQWKDSRFPGTCDVWRNEKFENKKDLIKFFEHHLNCASF